MAGKSFATSPKRGVNQWNNGNPLEVLNDIASDLRRGLTEDLLGKTASDLISESAELLGLKPRKKISGTLEPNQTLDLSTLEAQTEAQTEDRIVQMETSFRPLSENLLFQKNERAIEREIETLLLEIKREVKRFDEATKNLENEAAKIIVEEVPPNPGIYHVNFFEWLLGILRNIRQKVEDAGAWLSLLQSKKAKRGYWSMFKKHGTTFGLSSERVVATQTG